LKFPTTDCLTERKRRARLFARTGWLSMPVLTSRDEAALEKDYAPWPARVMVIDPKGYIALNTGLVNCPSSSYFDVQTVTAWMTSHL
jgi:hypothetical protein